MNTQRVATLTVVAIERIRPDRLGDPYMELVTASDDMDRLPVRTVEFVMPEGSMKVGDPATVAVDIQVTA